MTTLQLVLTLKKVRYLPNFLTQHPHFFSMQGSGLYYLHTGRDWVESTHADAVVERDRFAEALPAATTIGRMITLKRRI